MISPLSIFTRGLFGPVFQREVRSSGRQVSTYWVRGGYVLALTIIASMVYFGFTADSRLGVRGNAESLQRLQTFAPTLGGFYIWFQFVVMCFVASTLTAPAICDERRKGSLATLIATPLTPTQIILGKLSGRLSQLIVLLVAGAPLLLAVRIFGGVSGWFVLSATCITLCAALLHASISLAASARVRSPAMASGTGFVSGIGLCALPLFVALFLQVSGFRGYEEEAVAFSPYFALGFETARSMGEGPSGGLWRWSWLASCGYSLTIASCFLLLAVLRFRRLALMAGEGGLASEPRRRAGPKRAASPARPVLPVSTSDAPSVASPDPTPTPAPSDPRSDEIQIRGNPVLWRELRQPLFLRWWHPWLIVGVVGALLTLAYYQSGLSESAPMFIAQIALAAVFMFQACIIATGALAGERESRSLDTLLTTPLSARSIVLAKWVGAVRRLYPLPALALALMLVLGVLPGTFGPEALLHYALIFLAPAAALAATGLWLSVVTRKTSVAATLNVLLAFALWVGIPFLVGTTMLIMTAGQGPGSIAQRFLGCLLIAHPGPMYITALIGASENSRGGRAYHSFLDFTPALFTLAAVASALFYAMIAALFLHLAAHALGTRTNRRT